MGAATKIEWCHHTYNPWYGCTKVAPACDHCYAEGWAKRSGLVAWGPHAARRQASSASLRQPLKWNAAAVAAGERRRVFCLSLGDWLDNQIPPHWRAGLAMMIAATPALDWLLLTKRIANFAKLTPWPEAPVPLNVWLGITCGDQSEYDRDWPYLREISASVLFVSHEPALGCLANFGDLTPDWIIVGGESGPGARMMDPAWARTTRDSCRANGIAYFFKQMTGKRPIPPDLLIREFP